MKRELPRQPLWTLRSLGRLAWPDRAPKKNCTLVTFWGGVLQQQKRGRKQKEVSKEVAWGNWVSVIMGKLPTGKLSKESVFTAFSLFPHLWCSKQRLNLDHQERRCWSMGGGVWFGLDFVDRLALSLLCSHD